MTTTCSVKKDVGGDARPRARLLWWIGPEQPSENHTPSVLVCRPTPHDAAGGGKGRFESLGVEA